MEDRVYSLLEQSTRLLEQKFGEELVEAVLRFDGSDRHKAFREALTESLKHKDLVEIMYRQGYVITPKAGQGGKEAKRPRKDGEEDQSKD